jgi:octaprenyl-diphosphate synthase
MAFQLVDDVLDYRGESGAMGKNTGDDLREGKMTLPVILALSEGTSEEVAVIKSALGKPDATDAALAQVVAIMARTKTLDRTVEKAHEHVRRAREALLPLPKSEMRDILSDIAEFYVSRAY